MHINPRLLFLLSVFAATQALGAEKTPPEIARYLRKQGPVIEHKIFRSSAPREQMVVSYCVDENLKGGVNEGASNPANAHCHAALFNKESGWVFADRISIGQGSVRQFKDGVLKGVAVTYAPEDALCCPSKKKRIVFTTSGGKFVASPR